MHKFQPQKSQKLIVVRQRFFCKICDANWENTNLRQIYLTTNVPPFTSFTCFTCFTKNLWDCRNPSPLFSKFQNKRKTFNVVEGIVQSACTCMCGIADSCYARRWKLLLWICHCGWEGGWGPSKISRTDCILSLPL